VGRLAEAVGEVVVIVVAVPVVVEEKTLVLMILW
jgi:hypothetical protein